MISFKLFVEAIHQAIAAAGDSLMNKNQHLLEKYFSEFPDAKEPGKKVLSPKIVKLEYPTLDSEGKDRKSVV